MATGAISTKLLSRKFVTPYNFGSVENYNNGVSYTGRDYEFRTMLAIEASANGVTSVWRSPPYIDANGFSIYVRPISLLLIGGGGGGGTNNTYYAANGGGGGNITWVDSLSITPDTDYVITIGAGGAGAGAGTTNNGTTGGTSTAFGYTSTGGAGGTYSTSSAEYGNDGTNNQYDGPSSGPYGASTPDYLPGFPDSVTAVYNTSTVIRNGVGGAGRAGRNLNYTDCSHREGNHGGGSGGYRCTVGTQTTDNGGTDGQVNTGGGGGAWFGGANGGSGGCFLFVWRYRMPYK